MRITNSISIKDNNDGLSLFYDANIHKFFKDGRTQKERVLFCESDEQYQDLTKDFLSEQETKEINKIPILGFINLTNECNMECSFCFAHKNEEKINSMVSVDAIKYLKTILPKESFDYVVISGGEPLLYFDKLRDVRAEFTNCTVYTNGSLLNEEVVKWAIETKTAFYITLDYDIDGFSGHDSKNVRKIVQNLIDKFEDFQKLISLGTVIPIDMLCNLSTYREEQEYPFEKKCWRIFNFVDPIGNDYNLNMEIFENELDLIESGKIEIHNSIFFRYINYWQQACNNKFNLSSCSNTLTLNHRNEISTCMEFASKPIEFTNGKYNFIPAYEFQLNKINTLLKGKYGTHSICNADCYLRYICGGICWIKTLEEKKLMCEVAKIASAYALYLKINYIKSKNIINPLKGII